MLLALLLLATACQSSPPLPPPQFVRIIGAGILEAPIGAVFTRDGRLNVTNSGDSSLKVFDGVGNLVQTIGREGSKPGEFNRPMHLGADGAGNLYVPEYLNDRVQVLSPQGKPLRQWGSLGNGPGQFDAPAGVAVDRQGFVYVADAYNHRVQKFTPDGHYLGTIGGILDFGIKGTGPGRFHVATGIALDARDRLYVADFYNHRIQVFDSDGNPLNVWGQEGNAPGQLELPTDVLIGPDGSIFIVDFGNNRLQEFRWRSP